jgi:hypothetical protein
VGLIVEIPPLTSLLLIWMHVCEIRPYEVHAYKMHAYEMQAHEMQAYEGFCEDLARQNAVAQLSQLQLRFRRRHIWVSDVTGVS